MSSFFIPSGRPTQQAADAGDIPKVTTRPFQKSLSIVAVSILVGFAVMVWRAVESDTDANPRLMNPQSKLLNVNVPVVSALCVTAPMIRPAKTITTPQGDEVIVDSDTGCVIAIRDGRTRRSVDPWTNQELPPTDTDEVQQLARMP